MKTAMVQAWVSELVLVLVPEQELASEWAQASVPEWELASALRTPQRPAPASNPTANADTNCRHCCHRCCRDKANTHTDRPPLHWPG